MSLKSPPRLIAEIVGLCVVASLAIVVSDPSLTARLFQESRDQSSDQERTLAEESATNNSFSLSQERSESGFQTRASLTPAHPATGEAFPGYTLVPEVGSGLVKLVNLTGNVVHQWEFDADRARLLPNGHIVVLHGSKWGLTIPKWSELQNVIREYDWDGNLVWEYTEPGRIHHDLSVLPNGNILALHRLDLPVSYSERLSNPVLRGLKIRSDEIFEVTRDGKKVWSWMAHEHLDPNSCGKEPCPKDLRKSIRNGKKPFDWTHTNTVSVLPPNKWFDSGDKRFRPGNILTVVRNMSRVFLIDKETKDVVWQYSGSYRGGLEYGHEAHMIPKGLPGEGNILVFDNGTQRLESAILELDPIRSEPVWIYDAGRDFYSRVQGSMQRLPNGNTLISEDLGPRVFEVTPQKEIVWEFRGTTPRFARAQKYQADYSDKFESLELRSRGTL